MHCFITVLVFFVCILTTTIAGGNRYQTHHDKKVQGTPDVTYTAKSATACVVKCSWSNKRRLINYKSATQQCECFSADGNLISDPGWKVMVRVCFS